MGDYDHIGAAWGIFDPDIRFISWIIFWFVLGLWKFLEIAWWIGVRILNG